MLYTYTKMWFWMIDTYLPVLYYDFPDVSYSQWTHDVLITSLLRPNDVATSFWCTNKVTITSCVHWVASFYKPLSNKTLTWFGCSDDQCLQNSHHMDVYGGESDNYHCLYHIMLRGDTSICMYYVLIKLSTFTHLWPYFNGGLANGHWNECMEK